MIYLRPSRRIKDTESAGNIVISESLLDEHLSHIAYFAGDKRPFALRIEASNGVVLDEHSTTATELSVRIYTREGVDVTEFIGSLKPSWQIGSEEVEKGLSYTVQASILKNWHTKIIVTTTAARILDAMGKLQSKSPEEQRLLERLTIDASIEVRRDFVLMKRIPTAELIRDTLKNDTEFIRAVTGPQGVQGPRGIQGPQGAKGAQGDKGEPGKDATPVHPNLWLSDVKIYPNMGHGADNVHVTYKGDGIYRVTKHDKMYVVVSMYSDKLQEEKTTKTIITSWRVAGASRQELLDEKYLKNKNGRYYIAKNTEHKEVNVRGTLYAHPWRGDENHWIDGDWIEFADVKVELVEDGDILEPTAYIPNIPRLDYLATSTAQKVTQESIYLSRIRNGMASNQDLRQVSKVVDEHKDNWNNLDKTYIEPIRKAQELLKSQQERLGKKMGNVEKDIVKFEHKAEDTISQEWTEWTERKFIGKPNVGGGHFEVKHHYEIYRDMELIPPVYMERSRKILKPDSYGNGDGNVHQDVDANIIYSFMDIGDIPVGEARHWLLFTPTLVGSILRHGRKTKMHNPNMQGQQHGDYYNVALEKGTSYDIYVHNNGGSKYKIYVIINGAYK